MPVSVRTPELTLEGVRQFYIAVGKPAWKLETLTDLYRILDVSHILIYGNTRECVDEIASLLPDSAVHDDMTHEEKDSLISSFRSGRTRALVSKNRIRVDEVCLVINYDIPPIQYYLDRGGRLPGAAGTFVFNFVTPAEEHLLKEIQTYFQISIDEMPNDIDWLSTNLVVN